MAEGEWVSEDGRQGSQSGEEDRSPPHKDDKSSEGLLLFYPTWNGKNWGNIHRVTWPDIGVHRTTLPATKEKSGSRELG